MVLRTDPDTRFGRTGLPEVRADPRLRALFERADVIHFAPVRVGPDGALVGARPIATDVLFLPEPNPADLEPSSDRIGTGFSAVQWILACAIGGCFAFIQTYDELHDTVFWPGFVGWLVLFGAAALALKEVHRQQIHLRDRNQARPGNPGIFLLRDALVIRRNGTCAIFPRHAILALGESIRGGSAQFGETPVFYTVTQITYQGLRGDCTYTLDVGPPMVVAPPPELAAREQLRAARLRRLQAWLKE